MQDKDNMESTFFQLFKPVINKRTEEKFKDFGVDNYVKKLKTEQLLQLIIHSQLKQQSSLRDISNSLNDENFSNAIKLDSISASQVSRRLRELSPAVVEQVFQNVITEIGTNYGFESVRKALGKLYLIDSTTISMCLSKYPWAKFRKTKSGVKLHLRLSFSEENTLPDKAVVSPAKPADKNHMDNLVVEEKDALNVFDRAYVDYGKFDSYCEQGIRFVTRIKDNAIVKTIRANPAENPIEKDQVVYLGKEEITQMKYPLRLIETSDTEGNLVRIITNDFSLSAEEIGEIYRHRWQIELFFKWIKQHLSIKHFYGTSQQAVENQILIALITYCLLVILKQKTGYKGSLLNIKRLLDTCLYELFVLFVKKLYPQGKRTSKGRRKIDHELVFENTLRQVIEGDTGHLNDLTYDPLF